MTQLVCKHNILMKLMLVNSIFHNDINKLIGTSHIALACTYIRNKIINYIFNLMMWSYFRSRHIYRFKKFIKSTIF
jgi:hypothetical protein